MNLDFSPGFKKRIPVGLLLLTGLCVFYFFPNRFQLFTPVQMDRTWLDDWVPLSPIWIWFYVGCYFFVAWIFLTAKSQKNAKCIFWSLLLAAAFSSFIFWVFPTVIDRGRYPLLEGGISTIMLGWIRAADNSVNCFPSMHVAMTVIACYGFYRDSKRTLPVALLIGFGVCISTLATKQHYFYDVLGGLVVGLFAWLWMQWRISASRK